MIRCFNSDEVASLIRLSPHVKYLKSDALVFDKKGEPVLEAGNYALVEYMDVYFLVVNKKDRIGEIYQFDLLEDAVEMLGRIL